MGSKQTRHHRSNPLDVEILRSGVLLSFHANPRHLPLGADPLPVGVPSDVGVANAEGNAELFARQNHVHNHPAGLGWNLHHAHYARTLHGKFPCEPNTMTVVVNRVYLMPLEVPFTATVNRIAVTYFTPVAGNIRAGIYQDNGDTPFGGSLLVESASVAKSGTDRAQEIVIAATQLTPGLYWTAVVSDEATTMVFRILWRMWETASLVSRKYLLGVYGPLTNPCPAVTSESATPCVYMRVTSVP